MSGSDMPPFEDFGCYTQILDPAVRAGADDRLIDSDVADIADPFRIGGEMGKGDLGLDLDTSISMID